MASVVPFRPKTNVEFEGRALHRLTMMAATAARTPVMIEPGQNALNNPLVGMVHKLVEAMTVLEGAIATVETSAQWVIDDAEPGEEQMLEAESSHHDFRVTMRAVVRCGVIYIREFQLQRIATVVPIRRTATA